MAHVINRRPFTTVDRVQSQLGRTSWHSDMLYSEYCGVSPVSIIQTFVYHRRYILLATYSVDA